MARRRLLSDEAWAAFMNPPADEREIVRHYTLTRDDLDLLGTKRSGATRLGFALTMLYMRCPGRVLEAGEAVPAPVLRYVARQLDLPASAFDEYARRDTTRREHLAELTKLFGFTMFDRPAAQTMVTFLTAAAQTINRPHQLVGILVDELHRRRVLLPSPAVMEAVVRGARTRAERLSHEVLTSNLSAETLRSLDALLEMRPEAKVTWLAWLRNAPQSPAPGNIGKLIDRVGHVRGLGLDRTRAGLLPVAVFERRADEAVRLTAQHLAELKAPRRHAVLAAAGIRLEEVLTDATLVMFGKLMASLGRAAERRTQEKAVASIRALQAPLRILSVAGRAVINAEAAGHDPVQMIREKVDWEKFKSASASAEALAPHEAVDHTAELIARHRTVRQFGPKLLDAFMFEGSPTVASLLAALEVIRGLYATGKRKLPPSVPLRFVPHRWRPFVISKDGVDRAAYELCAFAELRERLAAGDVWVAGSRQFKPFDSYLLPRPTFEALRAAGPLPVSVAPAFSDHLAERRAALDEALASVAALARSGQLPDVKLDENGLTITPLRAATPPAAEIAKRDAYDRLPRVKITDVLLDVDAWTRFSDCFTHRRSGRPADDRHALLTCILADGINLGLTRMADTCRGASLRQLAHVHDWHVSEETYAEALGRLIDAHRVLPLAQAWGDGTTSSSDGQHFFAGGRGASIADINARHGNEPGVAFYTHISDQYGPFHTKVIAATAGEAPHVLDGLLYHQSGLQIAEHFVDTGGASDMVFGLMPFFGFSFAPRLRDLKERKLHLPPGTAIDPLLAPMVDRPIEVDHIAAHWDELLRLATSIRSGTVTASALLRKLSAYPRQNGLAVALRETGRLERSLFMLEWIRNAELRRRAQGGLNKGEARNALARALFFCQLGEVRDRTFENQIYRASGLNLLVAAVILWNTRYLEVAAAELGLGSEIMRHVAPLGWEHLSLTGDYSWNADEQPAPGELRPLRTQTSLLVA